MKRKGIEAVMFRERRCVRLGHWLSHVFKGSEFCWRKTRPFAVLGSVVLLAACAGAVGFDRIRGVEETRLHNQSMSDVLKLLGKPNGYYATPDNETQILTYSTTVRGGSPTPAGCVVLSGLAGAGGDCPSGGAVVQQCVALRFGPDRRLVEIDRPQLIAGPCAEKSHDRFLPATRRPLEAIPQ